MGSICEKIKGNKSHSPVPLKVSKKNDLHPLESGIVSECHRGNLRDLVLLEPAVTHAILIN